MKTITKTTIVMLLTVFVLSSILFSADSFAIASDELPSKEEFLQMVTIDNNYVKYKNDLIKSEPKLVNYLRDENNNVYGYIAQFEFEYGYDVQETIQLASLLTFTYDVKKKQVDTLIIDYSKSYLDGKIYVRDHAGDIQASYQVNENENLRSYLTSLTDKAEKLKKSYDSDVTLVDRYCWTCTRYEEYGDTYEGTCAAMVGGACVFADKIPFGRIICAGATVIGCYVPPYKICAEGRWNTRCPVEE